MHAPPICPILYASILYQAFTYSSIPLHMCTHLFIPSCMHVPISITMHACTHVCTYLSHPSHHACTNACLHLSKPSRGVLLPLPSGMYKPLHHITHACTHPSDHTCMHAIIQAVLTRAPAAPDTEMSTVNAEPSPQSSALYPAALELTKIGPPEKPGFKLSCSDHRPR